VHRRFLGHLVGVAAGPLVDQRRVAAILMCAVDLGEPRVVDRLLGLRLDHILTERLLAVAPLLAGLVRRLLAGGRVGLAHGRAGELLGSDVVVHQTSSLAIR
jgi:hypothetical protein